MSYSYEFLASYYAICPELQPYLSPGCFPRRIGFGFRRSCDVEKGKRSPFFQFSNTRHCPFRRLLASRSSAAWLVSVVFGRRHSRRLRGLVCGSPWLNARTGHSKRSLLGFVAWDAGPDDAGEGACAHSVS